MNIAMLGAGAFGKALGKILSDNQHTVNYYDPFLYPDITIEKATYQADAIVIAIPSAVVPDFINQYPNNLKRIPTIIATKGLLNSELFEGFTQLSAISGPAFATEIIDNKPATLTTSSPFAKELFENEQISIELCDDMEGILICGSIKNVYAIGAGYYSNSENSNAIFITRAHAETKRYLADHGARADTAELACGLGDLILTCSNDTSRNFTCGVMLREGKSIDEIIAKLKTVEGLSALKLITKNSYPLLAEVNAIVEGE